MEQKIIALAQQIGADIRLLRNGQGDLTALQTQAKGNLVAAINELRGALATSGVQIDDNAATTVTDKTLSVSKINSVVNAAVNAMKTDLLGTDVNEALDTFKEIQEALNNDPDFATTLSTSLSNKVDFSKAQTLTSEQKQQACENIGIGNPEHNYVQDYTTARDA